MSETGWLFPDDGGEADWGDYSTDPAKVPPPVTPDDLQALMDVARSSLARPQHDCVVCSPAGYARLVAAVPPADGDGRLSSLYALPVVECLSVAYAVVKAHELRAAGKRPYLLTE